MKVPHLDTFPQLVMLHIVIIKPVVWLIGKIFFRASCLYQTLLGCCVHRVAIKAEWPGGSRMQPPERLFLEHSTDRNYFASSLWQGTPAASLITVEMLRDSWLWRVFTQILTVMVCDCRLYSGWLKISLSCWIKSWEFSVLLCGHYIIQQHLGVASAFKKFLWCSIYWNNESKTTWSAFNLLFPLSDYRIAENIL